MNPTPIEQLIQVRLQQAKDSLKEAEVLFHNSLLRGTMNRAYYAMFYSILALGAQRQETTSKHSGVIAFFNREFVKTGVFPKGLSRSLHLAFQRRQENDYGDLISVDEEEAHQAILEAKTFIESVEKYLTGCTIN